MQDFRFENLFLFKLVKNINNDCGHRRVHATNACKNKRI